MISNPFGALPACSGGGIEGLSAACCCGTSEFDSDESVFIDRGRELPASDCPSSAVPLARPECLLALFVVGESFGCDMAIVGATVDGSEDAVVVVIVGVVMVVVVGD